MNLNKAPLLEIRVCVLTELLTFREYGRSFILQAIYFTIMSCLCVLFFLYATTIINNKYISIFLFNLTVGALINGCGFDRFNNH